MEGKWRKKLDRLERAFESGGVVEKIVLDETQKAKRLILSTYDRTSKHVKKRAAKVADTGPRGTLRQAIASQPITIQRIGDDFKVKLLNIDYLPFYWKVQEYGFGPSGKIKIPAWSQQFKIRGIRKNPSKRGDFFILRSPFRGEHVDERFAITLTGITHTQGAEARYFLRAGSQYLTQYALRAIKKRIGAYVNKISK